MFPKELLEAVGNWQFGWREDQDLRAALAAELKDKTSHLPAEFRTASSTCFRKRFLHKGEMVDMVLRDECDEGVTSWTTDKKYAERFKGHLRPGAISAAIFAHDPAEGDVVLNIPALWQNADFVSAASEYKECEENWAKALHGFNDSQQEIVLEVPLRGSEIIGMSSIASPFDELCDREKVPSDQRDALFKSLIDSGTYPGEPIYTSPEGAQRVIRKTIEGILEVIRTGKPWTPPTK